MIVIVSLADLSESAEVDFVISRGDVIVPVEVKAGKSGTLHSLLQFVQEKHSRVELRFDFNKPSVQTVRLSTPF